MSPAAPTIADCNDLAALLSRARGGETAIPLGHLGADGPSIHAAIVAMGGDDEDSDDICARGKW